MHLIIYLTQYIQNVTISIYNQYKTYDKDVLFFCVIFKI